MATTLDEHRGEPSRRLPAPTHHTPGVPVSTMSTDITAPVAGTITTIAVEAVKAHQVVVEIE